MAEADVVQLSVIRHVPETHLCMLRGWPDKPQAGCYFGDDVLRPAHERNAVHKISLGINVMFGESMNDRVPHLFELFDRLRPKILLVDLKLILSEQQRNIF